MNKVEGPGVAAPINHTLLNFKQVTLSGIHITVIVEVSEQENSRKACNISKPMYRYSLAQNANETRYNNAFRKNERRNEFPLNKIIFCYHRAATVLLAYNRHSFYCAADESCNAF